MITAHTHVAHPHTHTCCTPPKKTHTRTLHTSKIRKMTETIGNQGEQKILPKSGVGNTHVCVNMYYHAYSRACLIGKKVNTVERFVRNQATKNGLLIN